MQPDLYIALTQDKVIKEAALRSGVAKGVMQACWDAAGEVIKAWATEGHSVALPGLGTMRFGLRAKSVEKVEEVRCRRHSEPKILTQHHVRPEPLVLNHVKTQDSYATESKSKRTVSECGQGKITGTGV